MERRNRWQFFLIVGVLVLTIYNILPTIFYYTKPLKHPIELSQAESIATASLKRVNSLEEHSLSWLKSYNKLLHLNPTSIQLDQEDPQLVRISYRSIEEASLFKKHLPRAGALIPFTPAQLDLIPTNGKEVLVRRNIPLHFEAGQEKEFFSFVPKWDENENITPSYRAIVQDRLLQLALSTGGTSENANLAQIAIQDKRSDEFLMILAQNMNTYAEVFKGHPKLLNRFFGTFTQSTDRPSIPELLSSMNDLKDQVKLDRIALEEESKALQKKGEYLPSTKQERLEFLASRQEKLDKATALLKSHSTTFSNGAKPWTLKDLSEHLTDSLSIGLRNPFFETIQIDWSNETIQLELHPDVAAFREQTTDRYVKDMFDRLLFSEVARIGRDSGEELSPFRGNFRVTLSELPGSTGLLVFNLPKLAEKKSEELTHFIRTHWHPTHPDLNLPVWDMATYQTLPKSERKLGILVYAPITDNLSIKGLHNQSIYVIAKGMEQIIQKVSAHPNAPENATFMHEFNELRELLRKNGFISYSGASFSLDSSLASDFIFEEEGYFNYILSATRENFQTHGTIRFATLELSNVEQRILALNRIDDSIHADLLRWRDEFNAAQVNLNLHAKLDVPKPTSSPFLSNFVLSTVKYFRGDDRKILHWGLDLNGGKTVQIELRNQNNLVVKDEADLKQGINELYNRVNKMGVSEVSIRQEGNHIVLDFPGKQNLSASELVKASSMYFHVVNEKFSMKNKDLAPLINQFLQGVWNEAVVTNRKDPSSINQIAWRHLYGEAVDYNAVQPINDLAKTLHSQGLRLIPEGELGTSSAFNDQFSKIALYRGDSFTDWYGQSHPLLIVFRNYALEGSNLENVHASYDAAKGNFLSFEIASSQTLADGTKTNPRGDLYTWTNTFSKESVQGTPLSHFSQNKGWRMAVVLNGSVINAPDLDSALDRSAMISGSFTQREVQHLEADLKAGSLTFAPQILSEKNVSPELGLTDRNRGIAATIVALIAVISLMSFYYRFAGVVASVAVIFNLLIMWATLQNIQATMTLAGLAAMILTVGMAVDANVLVFERIREEFAASKRLASAVRAGYSKAFSAILDSNVTTVIAALILMNFDSGPVKGFAVTLIIGIVSSMFTALFMTRFFFAQWIQNPQNKELKMASLIHKTHFNFLKYGKIAIVLSTLVICAGGILSVTNKTTFLGMDFSGGFALTIDVEGQKGMNYRQAVEEALTHGGLSLQDIQVREQNPVSNIKLLLSTHLEDKGQPFYNMPLEIQNPDVSYPYQNNPRINWVVNTLQEQGLTLSNLDTIDQNWTSVSGQMSDAMRNNAILGLSLALLCILAYIAFRFEFKYAVAATLGLVFDVLFTMGFLGILHSIGVPVQVDLKIIAALMTIIGYSLNDTIIIFDRIREDLRLMRKHSMLEIINHALNVTLSRTLMTSGTTLIVLLALITIGGSTIFGLSLVMIIGVVYGTFSSLFIATPLLVFLQKREEVRTEKLLLNA
ncbi:MAG: protein translocase subunit SecD [Simkaniaceae bacterium]|nr:protein translocase subunit SecD [Simkaniaceae bacterium]